MGRQRRDDIDRKRFTTLLPEDVVIKLKHLAVDKRKPIYEVVEEAIDEYLVAQEDQSYKGSVE